MIIASLCVILGMVSYKREVFDFYGSLAATLMGLAVGYSAGLEWLLLMILFVLLGYGSTKYRYSFKKSIHAGEDHKGRRNGTNVLANGMVPVLFSVMSPWFPQNLMAAGFVASVASVTADTLSSELGVLNKGHPRLITTFKRVPPGTDGGISLLGELAGLAGILVIALASMLLGILPPEWALLSAAIGGFGGFHVDSLLGAVLERRGYMGNALVNLTSSVAAGVLGLGMAYLLLLP
jgi:uncharacterized protein (TIGR00297 family)